MMVYLAQQASGMHFSGDIVNVPGTSVMGAQKHAEYRVDPDALLEMVLDIFCRAGGWLTSKRLFFENNHLHFTPFRCKLCYY